jgi:prevent-host-death family protein
MSEIQVSMTELRQRLGTLVNRAAYGGERIVLVSRGEPRAAIVGIEDLRRLKQLSVSMTAESDRYTHALAAVDLLRGQIQRWQKAHGIESENSVETLRRLREERDDELDNVR